MDTGIGREHQRDQGGPEQDSPIRSFWLKEEPVYLASLVLLIKVLQLRQVDCQRALRRPNTAVGDAISTVSLGSSSPPDPPLTDGEAPVPGLHRADEPRRCIPRVHLNEVHAN